MKKHAYIYIILLGILVLFACKEETLAPLMIGEKPDPVTDYTVESLPGGAKIIFSVPPSEDLLYVKAEYEILAGLKRETKSSIYKNYLIVDGFEKEGLYEVTLYAVAKGEVESQPTKIEVRTLTPPYINAFNSIEMTAVFGGVNIKFRNEDEGNLSFHVIHVDSTHKWNHAFSHYTRFLEGNFSVRGYDTIPAQFGVYVRDRWNNISDTLTGTFKPLYESLIDKTPFRALKLPTDVWQAHSGAPSLVIEKVWNNNISDTDDCFHTTPNSGMPQHFSFDMGKTVKLSRFKLFQRSRTVWAAGNTKVFELWGSNNPSPDGSWDNWTKIDTFTSVKPSGLPVGTNSSEDIALTKIGEDFDVPITTPPYRYYRWNTTETWGNVTYISIAELTFWGAVTE